MEVAKADVEDWMIRTDEVIYGGYAARVALNDMPKEEADKYPADVPGLRERLHLLLLREKVDLRVSAETDEGCWKK